MYDNYKDQVWQEIGMSFIFILTEKNVFWSSVDNFYNL